MIGVLALQGAFAEHVHMVEGLGEECFEIRNLNGLSREMEGLILPGGESTAVGKLMRDLGMLERLKDMISSGLPVLGTCAGTILLADRIVDQDHVHLASMPITVRRNAYGRQLGSFSGTYEFKGLGEIPMVFIRAPCINEAREGAEILAEVDGRAVAARYRDQLAVTFHPELTGDTSVHEYFLEMTRS